ncbi:hypothetical protein BD410DRAFT_845635 [Rickenella mellea]|uniref:Mixed lineage kinase domain-containing protein n=1 Tax=Rickenella mellea TaxID=50990 RepID=A0A4Y7PHQ5_9AGAM|nr:hypothetical protein BD410DRAFT_845635 [Rickenella mellea]
MPLRRRLSRRASSPHSSADAQCMKDGSSSLVAAARAATPIALTALVQSADVFPPLKSAVSFLLQVHDICEKMKSNRDGADELRVRVEGVRGFVVEAFQNEKEICVELYDALIQFDDALTSILVAVDDVRWRKSRLSRLAFSAQDAETPRVVQRRLDDAMKLLMLIVALHQTTTLSAISHTLDATLVSVSRVEEGSAELRLTLVKPTGILIDEHNDKFLVGIPDTRILKRSSIHGPGRLNTVSSAPYALPGQGSKEFSIT